MQRLVVRCRDSLSCDLPLPFPRAGGGAPSDTRPRPRTTSHGSPECPRSTAPPDQNPAPPKPRPASPRNADAARLHGDASPNQPGTTILRADSLRLQRNRDIRHWSRASGRWRRASPHSRGPIFHYPYRKGPYSTRPACEYRRGSRHRRLPLRRRERYRAALNPVTADPAPDAPASAPRPAYLRSGWPAG
jgi:hypothetical protein